MRLLLSSKATLAAIRTTLQSNNEQVRIAGATLMYNCALFLPKDESDLVLEWTHSLCLALRRGLSFWSENLVRSNMFACLIVRICDFSCLLVLPSIINLHYLESMPNACHKELLALAFLVFRNSGLVALLSAYEMDPGAWSMLFLIRLTYTFLVWLFRPICLKYLEILIQYENYFFYNFTRYLCRQIHRSRKRNYK